MSLRYAGNGTLGINKDTKYRVVHAPGGWQIQLTYRMSTSEKALVTTQAHLRLVELVNAVKEDVHGAPGGAFIINEYGHVLVPTSDGCMYAGRYATPLHFRFEGADITAEAPATLAAGEVWKGPRAGSKYTLTGGGKDVRYEAETRPGVVTTVKLSGQIGQAAAMRTARLIARYKPAGGPFYVNEALMCFGPETANAEGTYLYLCHLDPEAWFPEPKM